MKIKPSQKGEANLSSTDAGKSFQNHEFLSRQICLLTLFMKINSNENFRIYSSGTGSLNVSNWSASTDTLCVRKE